MDLKRSEDDRTNNRRDDIAIWQTKTLAFKNDEAHTTGVIALLYDALVCCLRVIIHGIKHGNSEPQYFRSLEESAATLVFWGGDHDVSRGALDKILQHAQHLRDAVLLTLVSIGDLLSQRAANSLMGDNHTRLDEWKRCASDLTSFIETARYALEGSSDAYADQLWIELDGPELSRCLHIHVTNLTRLSDSLQSPAESDSDDEEQSHAISHQDVPVHRYFAALIKARFPGADAALVESLGHSNWSRYNHIKRQRETAQNDVETTSGEKARSEFHDSGIGSSSSVLNPEHQAYAATVVSSRAEASHRRLPPLPKTARDGQPFTCEICDRVVLIRRTRDWRLHIFKDICAYTCILPLCPVAGMLFEDHETMLSHLAAHHCVVPGLLDTVCPLCSEPVKGPLTTASMHLARHMEEIALNVLSASTELDDDLDAPEESGTESENVHIDQDQESRNTLPVEGDELEVDESVREALTNPREKAEDAVKGADKSTEAENPPTSASEDLYANNTDAANNDANSDDMMGGMTTDNLDDLFDMDEYENPEQSSFDDAFFNFD